MQIVRSEIRTGILVILTVGLLVGVVLYLSAPGLFRPIVHYRIFFDGSAGTNPGTNVALAGRTIGTVDFIERPRPNSLLPPVPPNSESCITVHGSADPP